jgi:hypothetical protein
MITTEQIIQSSGTPVVDLEDLATTIDALMALERDASACAVAMVAGDEHCTMGVRLGRTAVSRNRLRAVWACTGHILARTARPMPALIRPCTNARQRRALAAHPTDVGPA